MPICSYIIHPALGKTAELTDHLNSLHGCTAHPADNRDMIILVTDTIGKRDDETLQNTLSNITDIECMALSYANLEEDIHETA